MRRQRNRWWVMVAIAAMVWTPFCIAQDKDEDAVEMGNVVVTASRTAQDEKKVANSVTVITAKEIAAKGHRTVAEVLQNQPGIDISRNGGPGTTTSVFIRGADSKNTLLLIDGVPYNDPAASNRNPFMDHLTVDNIDRIEIVRGPQSVLYGSNATAGVINIITKKGTGKPGASITVEGGSFKTFRSTVASSGQIDRLRYSLSASYWGRGGYSIADANNGDLPKDSNTDEHDVYRNRTYSLSLQYFFTDSFDIKLTGRQTESESETDQYGPGYAGDEFQTDPIMWWLPPTAYPDGEHKDELHTDENMIRADIHNRFADGLFDSNIYVSHTDLARQGYDVNGSRSYDYTGKTESYGWQGNLNLPHDTITLGGEYYREFIENGDDIHENADTRSVWLQNEIDFEGLYILTGARYDRHDRFGEYITWRMAAAYTIAATNTKIKGSFGTGLRAPSLFELYSVYGSETLEPEESKGWDVGFEQGVADDKVRFGATYFFTEYQDMIDWDPTATHISMYGGYNQIKGDTDIKGVEAFLKLQATESLGFVLNYTHTDTEDDEGERLIRRPMNKFLLTTTYRVERLTLNLDMHWVGDRDAYSGSLDAEGNAVEELDKYFLMNLGATVDVSSRLQLFGRVENITNEEYETAWSYGMPERSYYLGAKATF